MGHRFEISHNGLKLILCLILPAKVSSVKSELDEKKGRTLEEISVLVCRSTSISATAFEFHPCMFSIIGHSGGSLEDILLQVEVHLCVKTCHSTSVVCLY